MIDFQMVIKKSISKGSKIEYQKEIRFKGVQTVTATVVAILGKFALLDNGDEVLVF